MGRPTPRRRQRSHQSHAGERGGSGCVARAQKGICPRGSSEHRKKAGYRKTGKDADRPPGDQREKQTDRQSLPTGLFPAHDRQSVGQLATCRSRSDQREWRMSCRYHLCSSAG